MSRVGKHPIPIPVGVKVTMEGRTIVVDGPQGKLDWAIHPEMKVNLDQNKLVIVRPSDDRYHRSLHGLTRTLIANMIQGVTSGFKRVLEIEGMGYRAEMKGGKLSLQLGYSHSILLQPPAGITVEVENPTRILVKGIDKALVGQVAAKIRSFRPPEPYKAKGIHYEGEYIRRKAGKTA